MVKVLLNPGIRRMSGKMGGWTFRWMHGQQTVMKTPDMSKVKWSKAQKAQRQRFKEAIAYARAAMADPKVRVQYETTGRKAGRQPFRVAVSDYFAGKNLLKVPTARGRPKGILEFGGLSADLPQLFFQPPVNHFLLGVGLRGAPCKGSTPPRLDR